MNWNLLLMIDLKLSTHKEQLPPRKLKFLHFQLTKHNLQLINFCPQICNLQLVILFPARKINLQLVKLLFAFRKKELATSKFVSLQLQLTTRNSQLATRKLYNRKLEN